MRLVQDNALKDSGNLLSGVNFHPELHFRGFLMIPIVTALFNKNPCKAFH